MATTSQILTKSENGSPSGASAREALSVRNLSKSYGAHNVLRDISFDLASGSVTCIIGGSGSGKSTLLRAISFLDPPGKGSVALGEELVEIVNGRPPAQDDHGLRRFRRRMGMVFQNFNLWPHRTAIENVAEGLIHVLGRSHRDALDRASVLLKRVGLEDKINHYPAMLSGGQQQRVAIARALAFEPEIILFDEPTSALDPELVGEVLAIILELAATGVTMLITTHEMGFVRRSSTDVIFLNKGKIHERGPPKELFERPQSEELKRFLLQPHSAFHAATS